MVVAVFCSEADDLTNYKQTAVEWRWRVVGDEDRLRESKVHAGPPSQKVDRVEWR